MKRSLVYFVCAIMSYNIMAQTVEPMLKSAWGQGTPYNDSCPDGSVAGCGPVAIGQILYFYQQPLHGYGSKTYNITTLDKEVTINYDEWTFDWNNILSNYSDITTDVNKKAVADLLYQVGVAMEANYGPSTAVNSYARMLFGLQHYLHISPDSRYLHRKYYSTAEWIEMINENLNAGHPVFYRGDWKFNGATAGHMYVIDGKNEDGLYHINWGNYGRNDKYVNINVLNQSGIQPGNRGVCYNYAQAAVFNCFPTPECDTYLPQTCTLNEPITLNSDKNLQALTVNLGETFTLGSKLRNCCDKPVSITFSWALVKNEERVSEFFNNSKYTLSAGNTFVNTVHQKITIPKDIEDGIYQLKMFWKSDLNNDQWHVVWDDAPNYADVKVKNGTVLITIPDNHAGNPNLVLNGNIEEVDTWSPGTVPGRSFHLPIINNTINNFEGIIKLEIVVEDITYEYQAEVAVYSQTNVDYHILIPYSTIDLQNKPIDSIRAYYIYEGNTYPMNDVHTNIDFIDANENAADINVFDINGNRIAHIPAEKTHYEYPQLLKKIQRGIYIVQEGKKIRKIKL